MLGSDDSADGPTGLSCNGVMSGSDVSAISSAAKFVRHPVYVRW